MNKTLVDNWNKTVGQEDIVYFLGDVSFGRYPFVNGKKKTIRVGAEVINYTPLDMDRLFELDFEKIERMETVCSKPV